MEEVEEEDGYIKRGRELRGVIGENLVKLYNPRWNQRTEPTNRVQTSSTRRPD